MVEDGEGSKQPPISNSYIANPMQEVQALEVGASRGKAFFVILILMSCKALALILMSNAQFPINLKFEESAKIEIM